jgi:hypothetical protein
LEPGITLRELAGRPVTDLRGGRQAPRGPRGDGDHQRARPARALPRRYVDRTQRAEIAELAVGDEATIDAEVRYALASIATASARS